MLFQPKQDPSQKPDGPCGRVKKMNTSIKVGAIAAVIAVVGLLALASSAVALGSGASSGSGTGMGGKGMMMNGAGSGTCTNDGQMLQTHLRTQIQDGTCLNNGTGMQFQGANAGNGVCDGTGLQDGTCTQDQTPLKQQIRAQDGNGQNCRNAVA